MGKSYDIIIIGGGAVGCAVAYSLSRYKLKIALLERNPDVCMGTSGKNSAVVHSGFNNPPGSLMAEMCVEGNKHFEGICQTLDVPFARTGKLVVALDEIDLPAIDEILHDGEKNGCLGLRKIGRAEMDDLEPNVNGIAALYSPNTAITNPFLYVIHLAEAAQQNGVDFHLNSEVMSIEREQGSYIVNCGNESFAGSAVINSAGVYSDAIAAMVGDTQYKIYPNRGEYLVLDKQATIIASRPIYPIPRKGIGGLGVHLTPTIDGNMLIGPSAEYVADREQCATTQKMMDTLFSEAMALLPPLKRELVIGAYTGMRAKTVPPGGGNFGDFIIEESAHAPGCINLIGIESPGLTASLPIAGRVGEMLDARFGLEKRDCWRAEYKGSPVFRKLDSDAQNRLILENADYGEIVCRCENITKAEVLAALNNPLGARTLIGVKNRVRTMTGRCQGGYCFSHIVDTMIRELDILPEEIVYRNKGDMPLFGRNK